MSAPIFQAVGGQSTGTASVNVAWPTHIIDDLGILVIETGGEGTTLTPPAGWTAVPGSPVTAVATNAGSKLQVWYKFATSAAEAAVATGDSGDHQVARIFTFRDVSKTGTFNVSTTGTKTTASTTVTWPSVTTTVGETRVVFIATRPNDNSSTTAFATYTQGGLDATLVEAGEAGTTSGHGGGFTLAHATKNSPGSTGAPTASTGTLSVTNAYMVFALRTKSFSLLADTCVFDETLQPATLTVDRTLIASSDTFAFNGNDVTLTKTTPAKILTADVATFTEDLKPANLTVARKVIAETGGIRLETNIAVVVFSDDFNRANAANLGANWNITQGAFAISSNKVYGGITDYRSIALPTANYSSDQGAKITASGNFSTAFDHVGIGVRLSSGLAQDYRTWTQLDPTSVLTNDPYTVSITAMNAVSGTGVHGQWYDGGTNWKTGDFWSSVGAVTVTAAQDETSRFIVASVTTTNTNGADSSNENRPSIQVRWVAGASVRKLELVQYRSTDNLTSTPIAIDSYQGPAVGLNTPFYLEFERVGSVANCRIYSDASHLTLVDTLTINLTEVVSFRYFYVAGKWSTGSPFTVNATIGPVNFDTPQTGYTFRGDGGSDGGRTLRRLSYGNLVAIGSPAIPIINGDIVELTAVGSLISIYINNILKYSVIDTAYTSGKPGITYEWGNTRDVFIDDFYSWNITANADLKASRTLSCDSATYIEDLKPANLNVSRTLFCAVATYTVEGTETNFNRGVSLTADSQPYTFIGRDATLFPSRYLSLARTTFTITGPPASLIAIADTHTVTIDPPAGWALHLVTDVSQAGISACIYYNLSPAVAVGDQILYRTTTETNSNSVSVSSTGIVSTVPSGSDTLKFRHWRPSTWSAELTFTVGITARTLTADTQTYTLTTNDAILYKSITAPTDIAQSIKGWFDASNESSLTVSSNNLTAWNDLSGQNDHLDTIQGNNPKSRTRTISGKNAIEFNNDGAIYDFDNTGGTSVPQATIGLVFVADANTGTIVSSRTTLDSKIVLNTTSNLVMYGGSSNQQASTRTISNSEIYTVVAVFNGTNSKLWINGVSESMSSIVEDRILIAMIGAGGAGDTYYFDGLVGEVAIYDNALSDSEALSLNSYLYKKWVLSKTILSDAGAYSLSGSDANFVVSRTLSCDPATYALDGKVTALPVKKIRYVNTTSTTGGTGRTNATTGADRAYATLRSALETEQADLIAQNVKLEIYCAGGADSSTSSQQNWPSMVTGPNNDIKIYAAPGNEAEESFNSNKYHIARFTGGQEAINLGTTDNLYISYYNLQIKSTLTTHVAFRIGATTSGTTTGKVVVSGCYIEGGTTAYGTSFNSRNQPHVVVNSILVTTGGAASNTIASVFYNNTVISYSTAAAAAPQPGSTIPYYMRNNIFQNYGGGVALSGTLPTNTSSNITNDATSPEVGLRNITLIFRDKVGKNYRLISEDSAGIGSGTNLSADPIYPITVDLLGSTRTTWDIGAVKYVPLISLSSSVYLLNTSETLLTASRTLSCDPATYAEDLQPANLTLQRKISSNVGYFRLLTVARQTNFSDNFNRADESLDASANWQRADIEVGSLSIINNRVSGGANIGNVYSGALADDQWAEFTFSGIAPSGTSKGAAVLLRATGGTSSFTGYVVSLERSNTEPGTDLVRIRYCLNVATFTNAFSLGTLLASYRVPDFANNTSGAVVLRAEVVGSIITAYINGSPCLFVSDSQSTSGKVGIWTDSANIDDFNSGSFTDTLFLKANRTLSCNPATYTLELKDATLTKVSAKVLTADSQTYNEDLQPANLKAARTLLATTQTYNEDLQPANLRIAKRLVADSQIYTFTGKDASFSSAEVFGTISRQYTLSGNNVLFLRSVISTSVAYTFTGRDANLFRGERLTAESRAYNLTGRDASLNHTARLTADTSTFTLTGRDANLLRGERLTADTSTYTFTGRDASLLRAERVTADVSSYSLSGQSANLLKNTRLVSDVQSYVFSGIDAIFRAARRLPAEEFRANYIRNSMMVGTIAGTPGTAPNLWATFVPTWCTRTIVGTGIDSTTGLTYIDVALSGTNSSGATSSILLDPINSTTAPAGAGQTWVSSAYFGLLVGSWPTSAVSIGTVSRDSLGSGTGNQYISIKGVSGSSLQRVSATYTIVSSSARYIQTVIRFDLLANDSLNLTIRIAAPQLERGSVARTFIPTTNAVQYRWFELAGQSANLLENRRLVAESSSYTLIRNDANLSVTRKLVADSSSYALTGNTVLFVTTGSLNVTTATFTLTGNSVNFVRSRILVAATQPYNFVLNDAILKTSKKVIADKATYTLTGRAANLAAGEISTSDSQSFILTGNSVRFNRSVKSIVFSYTLTASDTSLKVGRKISLTVSSYITSGIATNLLANKKILAVRVFFDTNGYVDPGYTDPNYVSIDAGIISSRLIIGQTITYNLNGNIVIIVRGGFIKVWTGSAWVSKPLKVWDGTAWVSKPLKVWTGSTWRTY